MSFTTLTNYNVHKLQVKKLLRISQIKLLRPHLLLYGPPGTGKTTLAKLYIKHCQAKAHNILLLNASNTRGIDTVRYTICDFVKFTSFDGTLKYIVLDEADYLTADAQAALREVMQNNIKFCNFILICNNIHRLSSAILSRCKLIQVPALTEVEMRAVINNLKKEMSVTLSDAQITSLISSAKGDIRYIINNINFPDSQNLALVNLLELDSAIVLQKFLETDKPIKAYLETLLTQLVNSQIPADKKVLGITLLAQCDANIAAGGSESIQFISMLNKLKRALK